MSVFLEEPTFGLPEKSFRDAILVILQVFGTPKDIQLRLEHWRKGITKGDIILIFGTVKKRRILDF